MAYSSGTITSADPAAAFITAIENALDAHTGQWEFVETVTISTIDYKIWKNLGTGATNNNSWGTDFYFSLNRVSATEIRVKCFEVWDATNKKMIRPCKANASSTAITINANGSFGDEVNGYTASETTNASYAGLASLTTTGLDYFIQATKDRVYVGLKQGTTDELCSWGVFETLLTSSPAESFPLYLQSGVTNNFTSNTSAWSRHPGSSGSLASGLKGGTPSTSLSPTMGGISTSANVDKFHNNSWLLGRPLVSASGGTPSDGTATGYYRGQIYDAVILNSNGATTRNGDTVTVQGDVYVKMASASFVNWIKRDAV